MDRSIKLIRYLSLLLILTSCYGQNNKTQITIHNETGEEIDSIIIHDVFDKEVTYHKVKKNKIITYKCNELGEKLPKGERGVFTACVFKGEYYYCHSVGFIGFPTATLQDAYELYIFKDYISEENDFDPKIIQKKYKVSEYLEQLKYRIKK